MATESKIFCSLYQNSAYLTVILTEKMGIFIDIWILDIGDQAKAGGVFLNLDIGWVSWKRRYGW